jgi:hypothetical protein
MSYVNHRVNKYILEEKEREREKKKELIRMKWSYRWASLTASTYYRIRAPIVQNVYVGQHRLLETAKWDPPSRSFHHDNFPKNSFPFSSLCH